jgi:hypothetical protein
MRDSPLLFRTGFTLLEKAGKVQGRRTTATSVTTGAPCRLPSRSASRMGTSSPANGSS